MLREAVEKGDQPSAIFEGIDEAFQEIWHRKIIRAGLRW
jgi:hypothetical protein